MVNTAEADGKKAIGVVKMMFSHKKYTPSVCPKTGKPIKQKSKFRWLTWLLPVTGLLALIWFLIRVIPKPSRATYPCQRVAFPLASSFIVWLMGLAGSIIAYHKAQKYVAKARYALAVVCAIASIGFIWVAMAADIRNQPITQADELPANTPIGDAKGINPGRVVWIHDANATDENCTNTHNGDGDADEDDDGWFCNHNNDQQVIDKMVSRAIRALAGTSSDYDAWDAMFHHFNQEKGRGDVGYSEGEKIIIKMNITSSWGYGTGWGNINYDFTKVENSYYGVAEASPHMTLAFIRQLVYVYGVQQQDIYIGDPMKHIYKHIYDLIHTEFPNIVFIDHDQSHTGRTPIVQSTTQIKYSDGGSILDYSSDYLPTCIADVDYMINISCLKGHARAGITLCAKNHFGSNMRDGAEHLHPGLVNPDGSSGTSGDERFDYGMYRVQVDLMGHEKLGQNTVLHVVDGLWAGPEAVGLANKWVSEPFNNDYTSSLFISQDQVALESVCHDFLRTEYTTDNGYTIDIWPTMPAVDDYLQQAADLNYWPASFTYDPEDDSSALESLGVHEHWNSSTDKQYSRNLGTDDGIELTTPNPADFNGDGFVDYNDLQVISGQWLQTAAGTPLEADIAPDPERDGIVNFKDFAVFAEYWGTKPQEPNLPLIVEGAELVEVYSSASTYFEGPTWDPVTNKLCFTNRTDNQLLRLDSPGSVTVWMSGTPYTNGTFLSLEGRLLTADENPKQISSHQIGASGPEDSQVLADQSDGISTKPNDLCQTDNGNIYFTGPDWGGAGPSSQWVYLLKTDGTVTKVASGLYQPNGTIASNDNTKLYVSESSSSNITRKRWWVYPINPDGTLGTGTVFFKPTSPPNTYDPDGMTTDERGNLYFAGLGGIWIVSPEGEQLEMVPIPEFCSNITFGGPQNKTLYMTCQDKVYSLAMNVHGGG